MVRLKAAFRLKIPLTEREIRKLKIGDFVEIDGTIFTARDSAHKYLIEKKPKEYRKKLKDGVIFHCGPIVKKVSGGWKIIATGPTTSTRMELYEAEIIKNYKIRAIIGKGGMGKYTLKTLKKYGCVYLLAVGGTAALLANSVKRVKNVHKLKEFGISEAIWELEVNDFPAIVTMDANGNSIHETVLKISRERYKKLLNN